MLPHAEILKIVMGFLFLELHSPIRHQPEFLTLVKCTRRSIFFGIERKIFSKNSNPDADRAIDAAPWLVGPADRRSSAHAALGRTA